MQRLGINETEAHLWMSRLSRDKNCKLIDLSRHVLSSDEVFQELERCRTGARGSAQRTREFGPAAQAKTTGLRPPGETRVQPERKGKRP
jgi:hypothetical protein